MSPSAGRGHGRRASIVAAGRHGSPGVGRRAGRGSGTAYRRTARQHGEERPGETRPRRTDGAGDRLVPGNRRGDRRRRRAPGAERRRAARAGAGRGVRPGGGRPRQQARGLRRRARPGDQRRRRAPPTARSTSPPTSGSPAPISPGWGNGAGAACGTSPVTRRPSSRPRRSTTACDGAPRGLPGLRRGGRGQRGHGELGDRRAHPREGGRGVRLPAGRPRPAQRVLDARRRPGGPPEPARVSATTGEAVPVDGGCVGSVLP
jgi:hypothetical protein